MSFRARIPIGTNTRLLPVVVLNVLIATAWSAAPALAFFAKAASLRDNRPSRPTLMGGVLRLARA